uniref:GRF-type domain-containing protein n=1 Tax=Oryza glumipatula TaxID=40148 RepID=A0A0D9ZPM8_9ORYZ
MENIYTNIPPPHNTRDRGDIALPFRRTGGRAGRTCDTASLPQPGRAAAWWRAVVRGPKAVARDRASHAAPWRKTAAVVRRRREGPRRSHWELSRWRGTSISGNGSRSSQGRSNPPPIRYREGPFDYYPAVLCDCRRKAARWISWSEDNPSRRYLTCARARDGGCTFWSWYEPETTPYLRQVLNDLHNVVRGLKEEKSILRASFVSAKAQIDELTAVHNGDVADWTRKLKEKDDLACELRARVVQLEEGRKLLLLIVAGLELVHEFAHEHLQFQKSRSQLPLTKSAVYG